MAGTSPAMTTSRASKTALRPDHILAREEPPQDGIDEIGPLLGRVVAGRDGEGGEVVGPFGPGLLRPVVAADMAVAAPQRERRAGDLALAVIRLVHGEVDAEGRAVILAHRMDLLGRRAARI